MATRGHCVWCRPVRGDHPRDRCRWNGQTGAPPSTECDARSFYNKIGVKQIGGQTPSAIAPRGEPRPTVVWNSRRLKLGCALPGELIATCGDALSRLADRFVLSVCRGARYWYGERKPSVARRARARTRSSGQRSSATCCVPCAGRQEARRTRRGVAEHLAWRDIHARWASTRSNATKPTPRSSTSTAPSSADWPNHHGSSSLASLTRPAGTVKCSRVKRLVAGDG